MAKLLKIITNPNPILRKKSKIIELGTINDGFYNDLLSNMAKTMLERDGVGLAAPQIGENIRLVVINTKEGPLHLFNPQIIKKSWRKEWGEEGCLSVPNTYGKVLRHKKIICHYVDKEGNKKAMEAIGLMARILQHEIDHLDGVLFIDKTKKIKAS